MKKIEQKQSIDWGITIVPLVIIVLVSVLLMCFPTASNNVISGLREIFVNKFGFFYILLGLGIFLIAIWLAFSKYGKIKLGNLEKPRYSNFSWGAMIFTSTMAADILYWSLVEWSYYYTSKPLGMDSMTLAQKQDWASSYPLFHWGPIPWAFYILPAAAYGYMMFVKNRHRQTLSEACRPVLKKHVDGVLGKIIDVFAIVGLLAGTATTFSLATPLLTQALARVLGIEPTNTLTIIMLVINAIVFTVAVLIGMKAISTVAKTCVIVFIALLTIFFAFGPKVYIIETGVSAIGNVIQNFFKMATWMDPIGASSIGGSTFPQSWTIFYWAYWIAWFVATPFFIGKISEGRTIKQTVLGGLSCGILGTYTSFIVFGGFGLFQQVKGKVDIAGQVAGDPSKVILSIFDQLPTINVVNIFELPITNIALIILVVAMIAFYASTFDAITMVVAGYSVKNLKKDEEPNKRLRIFWAAIFLLLPIALIYANNTLPMLQMISIIAAFPLGLIMILIVYSFFKDMRKDYKAAMGKNKISVIDEVIIEVPEEAEV